MSLIIRYLGIVPYHATYQAMQHLTDTRTPEMPDECWVLQHPPIYTLGMAGKTEHLLNTGDIPVFHCDRGGQVTYHGLGQLIVYVLMDVKRRGWGVRQLVTALEQGVIDYLATQGIVANRREKAPGVYVNAAKIAALGLRIRRGCSYHGLSFNVAMDLSPFAGINPCGYEGLTVTQLADFGKEPDFITVTEDFLACLLAALEYAADESICVASPL